jgi:outer membrane protein OmpA-like peptidoglycan-associated protein/tetratricopeptide (TPR) repeat protein
MISLLIDREFVHQDIFKIYKMKTLYKIFFLSLISFSVQSQSAKLKKADDFYHKLAYHNAIELYEDLLNTPLSNTELKSKLAHCYFSKGDINRAIETYSDALKSGNLPKEHYFYLAQSLKQVGNYAESDKWMQFFYDINNLDKRANNYVQNKNYLNQIENEGIHFSVSNAPFNTSSSDFGAYEYTPDSSLLVVSSRRNALIKNYWSWDGTNFLDLYRVRKSSNRIDYFSPSVNSKYHEGPLCFNLDYSKVYFTRNNIKKGKERRDEKGIQNLKIYIADVSIKDGSWTNIKELAFNSKDYSIGHPTISRDGKYLYFVSDMPGGFGGADLYKAPINEYGEVGKPENLGAKINTEGQEVFPWISGDGLLFFSSDGHVGLGGLDVFVCSIDNGVIANITNVGKPLNSQRDDFAINFSSNQQTGYFSSNREGGSGNDDVYSFILTKPFIFKTILSGVVKDKENNKILVGAKVLLKDKSGKIVNSAIADSNGGFSFPVEIGIVYEIIVSNENYIQNSDVVSITKESPREIKKEIYLDKTPDFSLYGIISDAKTGNVIPDVSILITDKYTKNVIFEGKTSNSGDFLINRLDVKIGTKLSYTVKISKSGYLSKTKDVEYQISKPGVINLHEILNISMAKVEIGADLASLVEIKPIYFDLGKFDIRTDAALELDKIVNIMNEYPNMIIELGSHTDCRSSKDFNLKLSSNRAKASADYIKKRITNPQRIYGKGYGESKLINDCACEGNLKSNCSEDEHQKNRRTEFIIIKF